MKPTEAFKVHGRVGEIIKPLSLAGGTLAVIGMGVSLVLKKEIDPELKKASILPYCEDIANETMRTGEGILVGGLPIDAFNYQNANIDPLNRTIQVDDDFDSLLLRDNETVRDFDIFLFGHDEASKLIRLSDDQQMETKLRLADTINRRAQLCCQPAPEISVFSFDNRHSPIYSSTTVSGEGTIILKQGFVNQSMPQEAMNPWQLVLANNVVLNILNPWEQYWRSMIRFSSGMKTKDSKKLGLMLARLRSIDELAGMEEDRLCNAYKLFYEKMLAQNSYSSIKEAVTSADRNFNQVMQLGQLVLASKVIYFGQKFNSIQKIVQSTPKVFNNFVGSR
jgi:hypothetical protein